MPAPPLQVTLVDCPGHGSLIRTIIGGAQIIDLVLLLVDATRGLQAQTVECVILAEITTPTLVIALNKIDLLEDKAWLEKLKADFHNSITISAKLRQSLDSLVEKIQENFASRMIRLELLIPHSRMDLVDLCYREGKVEEIKYLQKGIKVRLSLPRVLSQKLLHDNGIRIIN